MAADRKHLLDGDGDEDEGDYGHYGIYGDYYDSMWKKFTKQMSETGKLRGWKNAFVKRFTIK